MLKLLGFFLTSFAIAYITTPIVRRFARRYHVVARQNHRTVHDGEVPKLGGGAIYAAFLLGVGVLWLLQPDLIAAYYREVIGLVIGSSVLFFVGALDDKMDLNCNLKLVIEIAVASIAVALGWRVETILFPAGYELYLSFLSYPLSVLWIVGVANAFNMIDGLDGLAGGIAFVVSVVSLAIAALFGNTLVPFIAVLLMGAALGFLRYNVNPASIFMGDSGSLSLGFLLACITLNSSALYPGKSAFLIPLLLLGLPITDTTLAIIRRWRRGIHPFHADREHIHHRLVRLGFSQSGAALVMVGLSLILGIMAFLVAQGIYTDVVLVQ